MAAKQATPGSNEDCAVKGFCMEPWNVRKLGFMRVQLTSQPVCQYKAVKRCWANGPLIQNPIVSRDSCSSNTKAMGGEITRYLSWSHDLPESICKNSAGERLPIRKQKQGARSIPLEARNVIIACTVQRGCLPRPTWIKTAFMGRVGLGALDLYAHEQWGQRRIH